MKPGAEAERAALPEAFRKTTLTRSLKTKLVCSASFHSSCFSLWFVSTDIFSSFILFLLASSERTFIEIHSLKDRRHARPGDNRPTYLPSSFISLSFLPPWLPTDHGRRRRQLFLRISIANEEEGQQVEIGTPAADPRLGMGESGSPFGPAAAGGAADTCADGPSLRSG